MLVNLLPSHQAEWLYLARRQRLVDFPEDVGQQTVCPVPGVCVQDTIKLSYAQGLQSTSDSLQLDFAHATRNKHRMLL